MASPFSELVVSTVSTGRIATSERFSHRRRICAYPTLIRKVALSATERRNYPLTTARYAHLARDSMQTAASRITESIGGNLMQIEAKSQAPSTHEDGHPYKG